MTKKPDFNDSGIPYNIWIKKRNPVLYVELNSVFNLLANEYEGLRCNEMGGRFKV
jgi:hypothetical protein